MTAPPENTTMQVAPRPRRGRSLALLIVALGFAATPALAQDRQPPTEPARVQGVVVLEATSEPIPDALVSVVGTDIEAHTGPLGQFALSDVPVGPTWIRVTATGLPSVREQVEVSDGGVVFLQFRMPKDVFAVLDDVNVDVWSGQAATAEATSALELVAAKVPSISSITSADLGDRSNTAVRLRGVSSLTQSADPLIVVDDVVLRGTPPLEVLSHIPAGDVESIEVLRGPAAAFRYPFAANGVIAIKTKR